MSTSMQKQVIYLHHISFTPMFTFVNNRIRQTHTRCLLKKRNIYSVTVILYSQPHVYIYIYTDYLNCYDFRSLSLFCYTGLFHFPSLYCYLWIQCRDYLFFFFIVFTTDFCKIYQKRGGKNKHYTQENFSGQKNNNKHLNSMLFYISFSFSFSYIFIYLFIYCSFHNTTPQSYCITFCIFINTYNLDFAYHSTLLYFINLQVFLVLYRVLVKLVQL